MPGEQSCCNPQWHGPTRRIWLLMVIKQLVSSTLYIHISNRVRFSRAPVLSNSTQECQMGDGLYLNLRWTELKINTSYKPLSLCCFLKPIGCFNILLQGCIKNNIKRFNSLGLGLLLSATRVFHNTQDEPRVWISIFTVMDKNAIATVKQNAGYSCSQHM